MKTNSQWKSQSILLLSLATVFLVPRLFDVFNPEFAHYDEYITFQLARFPGYTWFTELMIHSTWPPLGYVFGTSLVRICDFHLLATRLLTLSIGAASMGLIAYVANRNYGTRAGWIVAFLYALSPVHVTYDSMARPYPFIYLFLIAFLALFIELRRSSSTAKWVGFALLGLILIYSHFWCGVILIFVYCGLIFKLWKTDHASGWKWKQPFIAALILVLGFLPYAVTFLYQLSVGDRESLGISFKTFPWYDHLWINWVGILGGRVFGSLLAIAVVAPLALQTHRKLAVWQGLHGLLVFILLPLLFGILMTNYVMPIYHPYRQAMFFSPPLLLCIAVMLSRHYEKSSWILMTLLALSFANTTRLSIQKRNRFHIPQDQMALRHTVTNMDWELSNTSIYSLDINLAYSFYSLHDAMDADYRMRDLWTWKPDWKREYWKTYLPQDLKRGRVLVLYSNVTDDIFDQFQADAEALGASHRTLPLPDGSSESLEIHEFILDR